MSTSANIIFASRYYTTDDYHLDDYINQDFDYIKNGSQIYIHLDGYPDNIIPILHSFLKSEPAKKRYNDESYLSAWFVVFYAMNYKLNYLRENIATSDYYNYKDYFIPNATDILNISDFSGIGLHNGIEGDTNYTYVITSVDRNNFNIWVYDGGKKFIDLF